VSRLGGGSTGRASHRIKAIRADRPVVITIIARFLQLRTVCRFAHVEGACKTRDRWRPTQEINRA